MIIREHTDINYNLPELPVTRHEFGMWSRESYCNMDVNGRLKVEISLLLLSFWLICCKAQIKINWWPMYNLHMEFNPQYITKDESTGCAFWLCIMAMKMMVMNTNRVDSFRWVTTQTLTSNPYHKGALLFFISSCAQHYFTLGTLRYRVVWNDSYDFEQNVHLLQQMTIFPTFPRKNLTKCVI